MLWARKDPAPYFLLYKSEGNKGLKFRLPSVGIGGKGIIFIAGSFNNYPGYLIQTLGEYGYADANAPYFFRYFNGNDIVDIKGSSNYDGNPNFEIPVPGSYINWGTYIVMSNWEIYEQ